MSTKRIVGIALLVIGLGLLFFGLQATDSFAEEVHETFTGRYTDETTWYLVGGAALAVGGLLLAIFGGKR
jgi:hypothetical protein